MSTSSFNKSCEPTPVQSGLKTENNFGVKKRKVIQWIWLCALGVSPTVAALDPWPAVEQPDLKQALERAPVLQTESLGEPARGVNVWERWFVPNPNGKTWDLLQIYFKEYYGPRYNEK